MTTPTARRPILGCIADDVTGATDLATNLVQGGMCAVQVFGVPTAEDLTGIDADAIVVALKSRSIPKADAIEQSLASLKALRATDVERFFFKYCSTFDSTADGNIGPVAAALMDALSVEATIVCPAFPRNGRTVYQGHLFVNGCLLNESGMQHHPLNPMTDASVVRLLQQQVPKDVALLPYEVVAGGAEQIRAQLCELSAASNPLIVTDACDDEHLTSLAHAVTDLKLVTGGSGIARFLPEAFRQAGIWSAPPFKPAPPRIDGRSLIIAGSCSTMTNRQVSWMASRCPAWALDVPAVIADPAATMTQLIAWAATVSPTQPLLISSTGSPDDVQQLQSRFGVEATAQAIEDFLATAAATLVNDHDVRRLVIAGGETSGAVVERLEIRSVRIGPKICPGVPWIESIGSPPLALALKSGNFGDEDFFETALQVISQKA